MALATVVKVEESSYRRIGARMLVAANGRFVGGISGGCLEGDALRKAQYAIYKKTPSKVVYDTLEEEEHQIGVGLGCNGRIEILFMPLEEGAANGPIALLREAVQANRPSVLLKRIGGGEEGALGRSVLLLEGQNVSGFADLDREKLVAIVEEVFERRRSKIINPSENNNVEVLVEFLRPETRLIIVGNNYDVNAMIGIGQVLGWQISVVGKKEKLLKSITESVHKTYDYSEVAQLPLDAYTAVLLMTHDYAWDLKILPHFLAHPIPYLGLLGPKKRFHKLNQDLQKSDPTLDLTKLAYLHAPTGLDIGAESPEEIALSVAAEILGVLRARNSQKLKHRIGPIHSRD